MGRGIGALEIHLRLERRSNIDLYVTLRILLGGQEQANPTQTQAEFTKDIGNKNDMSYGLRHCAGTKIIENDIRIGSRSMLPTGLGTTSTCNLRLQEDVNSLHVLSLDVDFLLSLVDLFVK